MIIHRSGVKLRGLCPGFVVHQSFWGQSANKRVQQRRVSTGINNKLNSTIEEPRDSCRDSGGVCVDIVDNPPISRGQWTVDTQSRVTTMGKLFVFILRGAAQWRSLL